MRPATDARAPEGTPLYVHLPFCVTKCPYCDFFSVPAEGQDQGGLVDAILAEAEQRAPKDPRTVFLGGGTPSLLEGPLLVRLLDRLDALTGFRASAREVTAECNPESLDPRKARLLVDLGVRRLSIGVQSLHDEALALFGRVHSADQALRAYEAARGAGAASVNVDLIFAHPGQDLATWRDDLRRVVALGPDHVAAYNLTFEEGTQFRRWQEQGRLRALPEEAELELFLATREELVQAGMRAYEVSNFCLEGHQCLHNINYWENGPYVGLGPSAVSALDGERRGNARTIGGYLRGLRAQGSAAAWTERLSPVERLGETWWLGLRTEAGVDPAGARRVAGWEGPEDPALAVAERLRDQGLLELHGRPHDGPHTRRHGELHGERFRLSPRGLPLADAVAREFIGLEAPATSHPSPVAPPVAPPAAP